MKKIFILMCCVAVALTASAQAIIKSSPVVDEMEDEYNLFGEAMSPNQTYVAGVNQSGNVPSIWNTVTGEIVSAYVQDTVWVLEYTYAMDTMWNYVFDSVPGWVYEYNFETSQIDSVWGMVATETKVDSSLVWSPIFNDQGEVVDSTCLTENYGHVLAIDTLDYYMENATGSLHAVTDAGLAVGDMGPEGNGRPIILDYATGAVSYLYTGADEYGSAYAISADGSMVAGFYYDDEWMTYACVWTDNGTTRTLLPKPTDEEAGFVVEYVTCRWMSADGKVILGYAQDDYSGNYVMMAWRKNAEGEYVVDASYAKTKYNSAGSAFDATIPYAEFEPTALSADGSQVALKVMANVDPLSPEFWDVMPTVARMNLTTGAIEELTPLEDVMKIEIFGVANDGTSVGRVEAGTPWDPQVTGFYWGAGTTELVSVEELLPNEKLVQHELQDITLSNISADGRYILGVNYYLAEQEEGSEMEFGGEYRQSFIVDMEAVYVAVETVRPEEVKAQKVIENGVLYILRDGVRYNVTGAAILKK